MKQVCDYCFEWTEGGTYIDGKKRFYFCSEKCLDKFEKERKNDTN